MIKRISYYLLMVILVLTACGENKPSIILIVVDALRADHLGCYGYNRNTSPALDSLASSGVRWTRAQAQAPWTLPGCASILSGLTVRSHGVREDVGNRYPLPPEMPTAATLMEEGGYFTVGIVNGFWVGPELGFNIGFQSFSAVDDGSGRAAISVNELIAELEELSSGQRYFALLHLYDVHAPYNPPPQYVRYWAYNNQSRRIYWNADMVTKVVNDPENRQDYINLYDGEIRWVDDQLARLFTWLRNSGRAENTVVIVTSDHGEEFLDHGWIEHSVTLYQELLHIPLIISGPGIPVGITDSTLVGQIDILPTILELAYLQVPEHLEGLSLLPPGENPGRIIPSSGATPNHWHPNGLRNRNWITVRQEDLKVIWFVDDDSAVTYDLSTDPGEYDPLPPDSALLERAMEHWATPRLFSQANALRLSDDILEKLKGLGYI